jgi:hypothetical protein
LTLPAAQCNCGLLSGDKLHSLSMAAWQVTTHLAPEKEASHDFTLCGQLSISYRMSGPSKAGLQGRVHSHAPAGVGTGQVLTFVGLKSPFPLWPPFKGSSQCHRLILASWQPEMTYQIFFFFCPWLFIFFYFNFILSFLHLLTYVYIIWTTSPHTPQILLLLQTSNFLFYYQLEKWS